jgi:cytochrome P450
VNPIYLEFVSSPEVQLRLHEEINLVLGYSGIPEFHRNRSKMPFTEAVLHEVQRMGSTVPVNVYRR